MALTNGALDGAVLLVGAAGGAGARLRLGTASRWNAVRDDVVATYGWAPEITSAGDGYRTLARQEELFRRNYTNTNTGYGPVKSWGGSLWWRKTAGTPSAAVPGTSNHGLGTTMDVVNVGTLNQFTTPRYLQFAAAAARHGLSNAEGRSIGEPWHWSDKLDPDVPTYTTESADMPLTQTDLEAIDRLIVDRLAQRFAAGTLAQVDKEAVDALIVNRTRQELAARLAEPILTTQADKETIDRLFVDRLAQGLAPVKTAIGALGTPHVDATELAHALAPLLSALSDADVERLAEATADLFSTRLAQ